MTASRGRGLLGPIHATLTPRHPYFPTPYTGSGEPLSHYSAIGTVQDKGCALELDRGQAPGEQGPGALYALPRYQPSSFSASTLSASCKLRPPIKPRLSLVTFNLCSGSQSTHYGIQFSRILSWVEGKKNPPRSSQHMTQRPPIGSAVPLWPGAEDRQTPCWTGSFPRGEKRRQNTVSTTLS